MQVEKIRRDIKSYSEDESIFSEKWLKIIKRKRKWNYSLNIEFSDLPLYDEPEKSEVITKVIDKLKEDIEKILKKYKFVYWEIWSGKYSLSIKIRPEYGYYKCPICNRLVEDSEENRLGFNSERLIMCPDLHHGSVFFNDSKLSSIYKKGFSIFNMDSINILKVPPRDMKGYRIYEEILHLAKEEEKGFLTIEIDRFKEDLDRIYLITLNNLPIGYATWNDDLKKTLRQIYIIKNYRHKGFGTALLRETVNYEAGKGKFNIESPERELIPLLLKLGYVHEENGKITGNRVGFVSGF